MRNEVSCIWIFVDTKKFFRDCIIESGAVFKMKNPGVYLRRNDEIPRQIFALAYTQGMRTTQL